MDNIYRKGQIVKEELVENNEEFDDIRRKYVLFMLKATYIYYYKEIHLNRTVFSNEECWLVKEKKSDLV